MITCSRCRRKGTHSFVFCLPADSHDWVYRCASNGICWRRHLNNMRNLKSKALQVARFTHRIGTEETTFFKRGDTAVGRVTRGGSFKVLRGPWARHKLIVSPGTFKLVTSLEV